MDLLCLKGFIIKNLLAKYLASIVGYTSLWIVYICMSCYYGRTSEGLKRTTRRILEGQEA